MTKSADHSKNKNNSHTIADTFKSVGSAFIGVQSNKKREQDFNKGKASHFIFAGIISTVLFITALVVIVSFVIPQ